MKANILYIYLFRTCKGHTVKVILRSSCMLVFCTHTIEYNTDMYVHVRTISAFVI